MDLDQHRTVIQEIVFPKAEKAAAILQELGLSGIPNQERVHRELEEKVLLPKATLPQHWLPTYQVCDNLSLTLNGITAERHGIDTGIRKYTFRRFYHVHRPHHQPNFRLFAPV